jgi:hypothetical protein
LTGIGCVRAQFTNVLYFNKLPVAYFIAYSGIGYDLVVGFLFLFKSTRIIAVLASLFFHISNKIAFNIGIHATAIPVCVARADSLCSLHAGIFPWVMLLSMTLFFEPDWPSRLVDCVSRRSATVEAPATTSQRQQPKKAHKWTAAEMV